MLPATPINNRLSDFRHMTELFTRRDETYFAPTLGVNNLRHTSTTGEDASQSCRPRLTDVAEHITEAQEILATDDHLPAPRRSAEPSVRARKSNPGNW